eukprot:scaffold308_cov327-Pavlova_lutheri.AAC.17
MALCNSEIAVGKRSNVALRWYRFSKPARRRSITNIPSSPVKTLRDPDTRMMGGTWRILMSSRISQPTKRQCCRNHSSSKSAIGRGMFPTTPAKLKRRSASLKSSKQSSMAWTIISSMTTTSSRYSWNWVNSTKSSDSSSNSLRSSLRSSALPILEGMSAIESSTSRRSVFEPRGRAPPRT